MVRSYFRYGTQGIIIAVLCLLSVEVAGALFFAWENGSLIYIRRIAEPAKQDSDVREGPAVRTPAEAASVFAARLHPYFGFAGPYEGELGGLYWNALGSLQRERITIPYAPRKNDLVVVIFGGSVAFNLAITPEGGTALDAALQVLPTFHDRKIVLINAALSGAKQPAQLFKLAYLLAIGQHIDFAINVDGFNEFALGWQNVVAGLPPIMPAAQNMRPLLSRLSDSPASEAFYEAAYRMYAARRSLMQHTNARERARAGIGYAWATAWATWGKRELASATIRYEQFVRSGDWGRTKRLFSLDLLETPQDDPIEQIYALWLRSSRQMRALAAANGIRYVHVVQPSQYFSKHRFSETERLIALSLPENHDYRIGIRKGYPLLAANLLSLRAEGIESAIDIFDGINDAVFADGCCHLNRLGETLLAQYVAGQAAAALDALPTHH
jgi:hypothetical protein